MSQPTLQVRAARECGVSGVGASRSTTTVNGCPRPLHDEDPPSVNEVPVSTKDRHLAYTCRWLSLRPDGARCTRWVGPVWRHPRPTGVGATATAPQHGRADATTSTAIASTASAPTRDVRSRMGNRLSFISRRCSGVREKRWWTRSRRVRRRVRAPPTAPPACSVARALSPRRHRPGRRHCVAGSSAARFTRPACRSTSSNIEVIRVSASRCGRRPSSARPVETTL